MSGARSTLDPPTCPLCGADRARPFARAAERSFLRCGDCLLTFLSSAERPGAAAERARYELHENDPADPAYRAFLAPVVEALAPRLPSGAEGLDYGCGPGPALVAMLAERGFRMRGYDPFFAPDEAALSRSYDFVTCTETAEHFHRPGEEFGRLDRLLREGGWLAVMTGVLADDPSFAGWHYVRDPTHVSIYRRETFEWLARRHRWRLELPLANVALFQKG